MTLLKFGAYACFAAAAVLVILMFFTPASRLGLGIGAAACVAAGVADLWFYYYFTPAMRKMPKPAGMEDEDPTTMRGMFRMNSALRREGIAKMESGTAMLREMTRSNRLREHGRKAQAEVLAVRDTGQLVNFDPVVEFDLRVTPDGGEPYHIAGYHQIVSKVIMPRVTVGGSYPAFVDPEDPNSLFITWS